MDLYSYTAILSKTMLVKDKVTYTDKRESHVPSRGRLDSECVTGHVLGADAMHARKEAIIALQRAYPKEQHYGNHENVSVEQVKETLVSPVLGQEQDSCTHHTLTLMWSEDSMIHRYYEIGCSHCGKKVSLPYGETVNRSLCIVAPIMEAFGLAWEAMAEEWCMCKQHKSEVQGV